LFQCIFQATSQLGRDQCTAQYWPDFISFPIILGANAIQACSALTIFIPFFKIKDFTILYEAVQRRVSGRVSVDRVTTHLTRDVPSKLVQVSSKGGDHSAVNTTARKYRAGSVDPMEAVPARQRTDSVEEVTGGDDIQKRKVSIPSERRLQSAPLLLAATSSLVTSDVTQDADGVPLDNSPGPDLNVPN